MTEIWGGPAGPPYHIKGRAALPRGTVIAVGDAVTNAPRPGKCETVSYYRKLLIISILQYAKASFSPLFHFLLKPYRKFFSPRRMVIKTMKTRVGKIARMPREICELTVAVSNACIYGATRRRNVIGQSRPIQHNQRQKFFSGAARQFRPFCWDCGRDAHSTLAPTIFVCLGAGVWEIEC